MTCPNCGATVAPGRRFCGRCGTALPASSPAGDVTASPPEPPNPSAWSAYDAATRLHGTPGAIPPTGAPGAGPGYEDAELQTNGLAVASLVLGLVGWIPCGVGSVLAIVFGFTARSQIAKSWGWETGDGMATAGIILGFIGTSLWIFVLIANIVHISGRTG